MIQTYFKILGAILLLFLLLVGINKLQQFQTFGSFTTPTKTEISQKKELAPVSPQLLKLLPSNIIPIGQIVDSSTSQDPSKTITTIHVLTKDNLGKITYVDIKQIKARYGFTIEPKWYIGYNRGLTGGIGIGIIRLNKVVIDGLVSYPGVGVGLSYEITNNSFIGIAFNQDYIPLYTQTPLVYLGSRF